MGVNAAPDDTETDTAAYDNKIWLSYAAFSKLCDEQLPYALALGMSPQDFWDGDAGLYWAFVKAGKIRREQEDALAWAQGWYVRAAVMDSLSYTAFSGVKRKKEGLYPEKPVFTTKVAERRKKADAHGAKSAKSEQDRIGERLLETMMLINERTNAALEDQT